MRGGRVSYLKISNSGAVRQEYSTFFSFFSSGGSLGSGFAGVSHGESLGFLDQSAIGSHRFELKPLFRSGVALEIGIPEPGADLLDRRVVVSDLQSSGEESAVAEGRVLGSVENQLVLVAFGKSRVDLAPRLGGGRRGESDFVLGCRSSEERALRHARNSHVGS